MVRLLMALLSVGVTVYFVLEMNKSSGEAAGPAYDEAYEKVQEVDQLMQKRVESLQKGLDDRIGDY